ncbi:MAG: sulfatase-like hydrolase/transferase [Bacteroidia bacterium]|nr:sulfatase-like hydrolase/transferase [Bacteroidia bacterium]
MKPYKFEGLIFSFILFCVTIQAQETKPNILLIIADDLGNDMIEGFGIEVTNGPSTPNLQALQDSGVSYLNTWATPQCTPTRAAIMSGKYGIKTGVMRPPGNLDLEHESVFSYVNRITDTAYATAVIGKWHISNPTNINHPHEHGIDHYEGIIGGTIDDYYDWPKVENGQSSQITEYVTTHLTDAAIDWMNGQNEPWFLWLAHIAPHGPWQVPPDGLYSVNNPTSNRQLYNATVEAMDHEIGRLINSMDQDTRENTIIIFIGDNGTPNGVMRYYPDGHGKGSMYEGGLRVPMIISGKGVSRMGEQELGLTQVTDLHATILELMANNLPGGIHNSYSLVSTLTAPNTISREYVYSDYRDGNILYWAIRNQEYKLIKNDQGSREFYRIDSSLEEQDNLIGSLSNEEASILAIMEAEADTIRNGWSCQDGILNGDEIEIDDCAIRSGCTQEDLLGFVNIGCCESPDYPSVYHEYFEGDQRHIYSNGFPNHDYCYNPNNIPEESYHFFRVDQVPVTSAQTTNIVRENGRPARHFGVALNGVILSPAPGVPFIFENPNTGEFNWDWVFEPTNNQGDDNNQVRLDCATAHTSGQGYHYHGEMFEYLETTQPGITALSTSTELFQVGWAADGFPILYKFGPDPSGVIKALLPSYQLKSGERPGDGIVQPCGPYTGKYTNDYEYIDGLGDLDACNGIASTITLETAAGLETFNYFYVVTSTFPQIGRCLIGNVSADFDNNDEPLTGVDNDGDGYLASFECDDNDPDINPSAVEIPDNGIDENCDGMDLVTSTYLIANTTISIYPNPTTAIINIDTGDLRNFDSTLYDISGKRLIDNIMNQPSINIRDLQPGIYILEIKDLDSGQKIIERIVKN